MRILITDGIEASAEQALLERGHEVVQKFYPPEELGEQLEQFDALIVRSATKVRQPAIDRAAAAGRLRVICRGGVGMDNIDVDYARSKGIAVRNTPGASTNSVAEMTLGLMLSAARHIGPATASMRQGQWNKKQYTGIELGGKTLGIAGFGRIGRRTAALARAFGMRVLAFNRSQCEEGRTLAEYVDLDTLLAESDFLSMHLPAAPGGCPLGRDETIARMKVGVVIVNAGRGCLIDEDALLRGLESGRVRAAGLDVYAAEPTANSALTSHPRVTCTPHIGAAAAEAQQRVGAELVSIIDEIFA